MGAYGLGKVWGTPWVVTGRQVRLLASARFLIPRVLDMRFDVLRPILAGGVLGCRERFLLPRRLGLRSMEVLQVVTGRCQPPGQSSLGGGPCAIDCLPCCRGGGLQRLFRTKLKATARLSQAFW